MSIRARPEQFFQVPARVHTQEPLPVVNLETSPPIQLSLDSNALIVLGIVGLVGLMAFLAFLSHDKKCRM
jgi:hypothetical protein